VFKPSAVATFMEKSEFSFNVNVPKYEKNPSNNYLHAAASI
jgi:hypothetical protein